MGNSSKSSTSTICVPFGAPTGPTDVVEIRENILWLRLPLPLSLDHVNIYVFDDEDSWTLIDTGMYTQVSKSIWQEVLRDRLAKKPIKRVVLTHHHPDHVGMAGWFRSEFGVEIISTRTAWLMARMLTLDVQENPSSEGLEFYQAAGVPDEHLSDYMARRPFNFADCVAPIPTGFTRIREGDRINFGGMNWKVKIGHGHAPSHATFWCEDEPLVIGGDQFLPDITPNISVYPTEREADPLGEWLNSCERFSEIANDEQLVLCGHKLPFFGLPKRLEQLIENHRQALERIKVCLAKPATAHDILETLFKRRIPKSEYGLAIGEAVAHLNYLHGRGEVIRNRNSRGAWIWSRQQSTIQNSKSSHCR